MVGAIALETTDRAGGVARKAAGDLRAEASALYPTEGNTGSSKHLTTTRRISFRIMVYLGALEIFYLADALT
jgi:hypothetical protein